MPHDCALQLLNSKGIQVDSEVAQPEWGQQNLRVFHGREKTFVLKMLPSCGLLKLPDTLCNRLFDSLHACTTSILLPIYMDDGYIWRFNQKPVMLFPLIGRLGSNEPQWDISLDDHVRFIARVHNELKRVPAALIEELMTHSLFVGVDPLWLKKLVEKLRNILGNEIADLCLELVDKLDENWAPESYSSLIHTDLLTSNIVLSAEGRLMAVDIDFLGVGNQYADLIYVLSSRGVDAKTFKDLLALYRSLIATRANTLSPNETLVGVHLVLTWISSISKRIEDATSHENIFLNKSAYMVAGVCPKGPSLIEDLDLEAYRSQLPLFLKGVKSVLRYVLDKNI